MPTFQWKHNGIVIQFANSSFYTIGTIAESDSGIYTVTVANSVGNVNSQPAQLTVFPAGMKNILAVGKFFLMGQTTLADTVHRVQFTHDFFMDTTEVTQADYLDIMGVNPSDFSNIANGPVQRVTWFDAVLYCNKRSKRLGKDTVYSYTSVSGTAGNGCSNLENLIIHYDKVGFRLPTEAEWEYACRGGTTTIYFWSNATDSTTLAKYAWWEYGVHTVAEKLPNAFDLYDMCGNVWEWCNDQYNDYPVPLYGSALQIDPKGAESGSTRAVRGGSYYSSNISEFGSAARNFFVPNGQSGFTGFRTVLPIN